MGNRNSNFQFLTDDGYNALFKRANQAEEFAYTDARASYVFCRIALEMGVKLTFELDYDLPTVSGNLNSLLGELWSHETIFEPALQRKTKQVKDAGNKAVHNNAIHEYKQPDILKNLFDFLKWFSSNYGDNPDTIDNVFDDTLLPRKEGKLYSSEELNYEIEQAKSELETLIRQTKWRIQNLQQELSRHVQLITEKEGELLNLQKIIHDSEDIKKEFLKLQLTDKKNESFYSFQILEVGMTEQCNDLWGKLFINFVSNNNKHYAVKHFSLSEDDKIEDSILIGYGKYQDCEWFNLFEKHHENLNFRSILSGDYDSLSLANSVHKRFGTPSILMNDLLLYLKKKFTFKLGDREYLENGFYKIDNEEFMSIWCFKNKYETKSENVTENNFQEAKKIKEKEVPFYKSKPDYGYFNEIKIYPVRYLKDFYNVQ